MHLYCMEIESQYGNTYWYTEQPNILEIAKRVNHYISQDTKMKVKAVYIVDDYDSPLVERIFMQSEYDIQYFFETYEDRLVAHYGLQHAV